MTLVGVHWSSYGALAIMVEEKSCELIKLDFRTVLEDIIEEIGEIDENEPYGNDDYIRAANYVRQNYINVARPPRDDFSMDDEAKRIIIIACSKEFSLYEICYLGKREYDDTKDEIDTLFNLEIVTKEELETYLEKGQYIAGRGIHYKYPSIKNLEYKLRDQSGKSANAKLKRKMKLLGQNKHHVGTRENEIQIVSIDGKEYIKQCGFSVLNDDENRVSYINILPGVEICYIDIGILCRLGRMKYGDTVIRSDGEELIKLNIANRDALNTDIVTSKSTLRFDIPRSRIYSMKELVTDQYFGIIDISGIKLGRIVDTSAAFKGNTATKIILGELDLRDVYSCSGMFLDCYYLEHIVGLDKVRFEAIKNMGNMFTRCHQMREIKFGCLKLRHGANMEAMFSSCSNLRQLDLRDVNMEYASYIQDMFYRCNELVGLKLPERLGGEHYIENTVMSKNIFKGVPYIDQMDMHTRKVIEYVNRCG